MPALIGAIPEVCKQVGAALARAPQLAAALPAPLPPETLHATMDKVGRWVRSAGDAALGVSAQGGVDAANDIMGALGIQVRIIRAAAPEGQAHVRVTAAAGQAQSNTEAPARRTTPREFVSFMRASRREGNMKGLGSYVDRLVADGRLRPMPALSQSLQRKLYVDIARLLVFIFQRSLLQLDGSSIWGHKLRVSSTAAFEGQRYGKSAVAIEKARRRRQGRASSEQQLGLVVEEMLSSQALHMPLVPRRVQKRLYVNCMAVVFELVDDLLSGDGEEIMCMGHRIRFRLEPQSQDLLARLSEDLPVAHCTIDEAVLSELVDELLADSSTNLAWVPDLIESQVYKAALRLLIRSAEHVIGRLHLNVLGREVRFSILSHMEAKAAQSKLERFDSGEAMLYTEEDQPLRIVSTTELQERLKDSTEQLRILGAIQELGSASFDLTADTPMLRSEAPKATSAAAAAGGSLGEAVGGASMAGTSEEVDAGGESVHEFQRLAYALKLARSLSIKCEVEAPVSIAYMMIADITTYPTWMPWCTSGKEIGDRGNAREFDGEVGFGFETGTFLGTVGDTVGYRLSVEPPQEDDAGAQRKPTARVVADAVNGFAYGERLVYDWRFQRLSPTRTKVDLDMLFQARSVLYMPLWDSMQKMVITKMLQSFEKRAEHLSREQAAARAARAAAGEASDAAGEETERQQWTFGVHNEMEGGGGRLATKLAWSLMPSARSTS